MQFDLLKRREFNTLLGGAIGCRLRRGRTSGVAFVGRRSAG